MRSSPLILVVASAAVLVPGQGEPDAAWTQDFPVEPGELVSTGRKPFFVLEPGYTLVLEDDEDRLVVTVLDETRQVAGIETRVVEERESEDGQLVEVSRNFFAISKRTNSVYYFGEEVDIYRDGKVVYHEGAWLAGEKGAHFGLLMPGQPLLGAKYYQEQAQGVAMDRAEVVGLKEKIQTPAGEFSDCLKTLETNALNSFSLGFKTYAPGIGRVQEESLRLVKYGKSAAK